MMVGRGSAVVRNRSEERVGWGMERWWNEEREALVDVMVERDAVLETVVDVYIR
jgi:hypothetical protein